MVADVTQVATLVDAGCFDLMQHPLGKCALFPVTDNYILNCMTPKGLVQVGDPKIGKETSNNKPCGIKGYTHSSRTDLC